MYPLGDSAIIVEFGRDITKSINERVLRAANYFIQHPFPALVEVVPAYTTLTIHYDPLIQSYENACTAIEQGLNQLDEIDLKLGKTIRIPVCYEEEYGPDLAIVADINQLSIDEVITIHTSETYDVYFLGFAPGFPFLGGMNPKIAAPRKSSPRLKIPQGSVGIAGGQTGVYPLETPGGWQIIGRTPIPLFTKEAIPPTLLQPGDKVQFVAISHAEYRQIERGEHIWEFAY